MKQDAQTNKATDTLVRVVSSDGCFRGLVAVTTNAVTEICARQQTDLTATVALGRLVTGGALLSGLLKGTQRLALQMEGNGPIGKMGVEADAKGRLRGTIRNPVTGLPPRNDRFDVVGAIGKAGFLTVWKDLGLKQPYQSTVQLQTSEIAEDLAWYLARSEQVPSSLGLGVELNEKGGVALAAGFLIQALPPEDPGKIDALIERIKTQPPVTTLLRQGQTPLDLLRNLLKTTDFPVCETQELIFYCPCSRSAIEQMLAGMGSTELSSMAEEKTTTVRCEYCRTEYHFSADELINLGRRS